jgi:hypothetical protein
MSAPNGYVEVVQRGRLWEGVPVAERVTEDDIRAKYPTPRFADFVAERLIDRLRNPRCELAVSLPEFRDKWIPCGWDDYGAGRCKRHGGPGKPREAKEARRSSRLTQVLAERDEWEGRARALADLLSRLAYCPDTSPEIRDLRWEAMKAAEALPSKR